jgi:predicted transcriptional regulator with HTH domain
MSFENLAFKYTPPPTIPDSSPVPSSTPQPSLFGTVGQPNAATTPAAGQLLARLADLLETNQYLQSLLLARSAGLGIKFDAASDPDTARALEGIYTNLPIPQNLTINIYNRMLDAEMTALQLESALGSSSTYETSGYQSAQVNQVNQAIEKSLLDSGQFQFQLPLLLRQLKGDAAILNNLSAQISQYPVIAAPGAPSVSASSNPNLVTMSGQDISPALVSSVNGTLNGLQSCYASVYQLAAGVGVVAQDVNNVLSTYFMEPAVNIIRMISMLQMLMSFTSLPRLKAVFNGLTGFAFIRLFMEASAMEFMLDRFVQTAMMPIEQMTSSIGMMLHQVAAAAADASTIANGVKGTFTNQTGALKGMSMGYNSGLPSSANAKKPAAPALNNISSGCLAMVTHLDWAVGEVTKKVHLLEESFNKLMARRLGDMSAQLDLMGSMQALNTMIALAQSVMSFNGSSAAVGASKSVPQVAAVGQILNGMQSTTGTSFVVTNGQMQAVPPTVPAPSSNVQNVLTKGGLTLIVASSATVQAPTIGAVS